MRLYSLLPAHRPRSCNRHAPCLYWEGENRKTGPWKRHCSARAASGAWRTSSARCPGVSDAVSGYAGGTTDNPDLPPGLRRRHLSCRGGRGDVRPGQGQLRDPGRPLLPDAQPHHPQPPGTGRGHPVPLGDLHPWRRSRPGSPRRCATGSRPPASGSSPIVTQIEPAPAFWKAEESHQRYFEKHGGHCHVSYAELEAEDAR